MSLPIQLFLGTAFLVGCSLIHVSVVIFCIPRLRRVSQLLSKHSQPVRHAAVLSFGLVAIVAAHTIEIWGWALGFHILRAFETFEASFYFSTVTYTTLGYGDLTLNEELRVFGTFASLTGLLAFGISTAFLIGILGRLLPGDSG